MNKRTAAVGAAAASLVALAGALSTAQAMPTTYNVALRMGTGMCLDIPNNEAYEGKQVQQWGCNGTDAQKWNLITMGSQYFEIQSASHPKMCLNNWNGHDNLRDPIALHACASGSPDNLWNVYNNEAANVQFQPKAARYNCLDMQGGTNWGDKAILWTCTDAPGENVTWW